MTPMSDNMTTIAVSTINRELLDQLGVLMTARHPHLWPARPTYNAIVGYAIARAFDDPLPRMSLSMAEEIRAGMR